MIAKEALPQDRDWNHFWGLEQTKQFTAVSWSKRRIIKTVEPYLQPGQKALDAGCGSGFFSKYFCDRGLETVALDFSVKALEITQTMTDQRAKTIQANLVEGNLLTRVDQKFDVIFTDGLFEHFDDVDQDRIMKNFLSVQAPRGVIITFVPNRWSPWELIRPFFMPGITEEPFTLSQLIKLHQRHGLSILAKGGVNTLPFAFSPDKIIGNIFGMLLYVIAQKDS